MKIGLLPFYLALYDNFRPERSDEIRAFAGKISKALEAKGFEVVSSPACRLKNEFHEAIKLFEKSGCEVIATLHLAYSPSLESYEALVNTNLPIIVIDTTDTEDFSDNGSPKNISYCHGIHGVMDGRINFSTGTVEASGQPNKSFKEILGGELSAGTHVMSICYLERGSSQSNCTMFFNIASRFELDLIKQTFLGKYLGDVKEI